MAELQRLDQQFPWNDDPLQSELRRLMSTLEPRFVNLENQIVNWEAAVENITAVGIDRVNEVLGPLLEQLNEAAQLGFLVAYAEDFENTMEEGEPFGIVITSAGKELFTPTPQLTIMDTDNEENWGTAVLQSYDKLTGDLTVTISFVNSPDTAGENWVVACGSGILPKTIAASDAAVVARNEVETLADQFADDLAALQVLLESLETGAVVSVNGQTGVVTLTFAISDVPGLQAALDAKASTSYVNTQISAKQSASAKLTSLSDLTWAVDYLFLMTSTSAVNKIPISTLGKSLLDDVDQAAAKTTLGFATSADITSALSGYALTSALSSYALTSSLSSYALTSSLSSYAPLASPALTGTPTAPTQTAGNNTTRIATTAFVTAAVAAGGGDSTAFVTLTDATTIAVDWSDSDANFMVTMSADRILGNPSNGVVGTTRRIVAKSTGAGRILNFASNYKNASAFSGITSLSWGVFTIFCVDTTHFIILDATLGT